MYKIDYPLFLRSISDRWITCAVAGCWSGEEMSLQREVLTLPLYSAATTVWRSDDGQIWWCTKWWRCQQCLWIVTRIVNGHKHSIYSVLAFVSHAGACHVVVLMGIVILSSSVLPHTRNPYLSLRQRGPDCYLWFHSNTTRTSKHSLRLRDQFAQADLTKDGGDGRFRQVPKSDYSFCFS